VKGVPFITFTDGRKRNYENTMREIPNFSIRSCVSYKPKHKYRYQDLDCRYCAEYKTCPPVCLCPYILDNLPDLYGDMDFIGAVIAAESCETAQRLTLLYLLEGRLCVFPIKN
jgi:hypothetical protein